MNDEEVKEMIKDLVKMQKKLTGTQYIQEDNDTGDRAYKAMGEASELLAELVFPNFHESEKFLESLW